METPGGPQDTYLAAAVGILRRRWPYVLACALIATGVALAVSSSAPKEYESKAELLFTEPRYEEVVYGIDAPAPDPGRQAATNLKLITRDAVSEAAGRKLGLSSGEVRGAIAISPQGEADLVSVTATWEDAEFAAKLANAYASSYIRLNQAMESARFRKAEKILEGQLAAMPPAAREGPEGELLTNRAKRLGVMGALQTGNAELASAAVPSSEPASPKPKRAAILGLVLGLLLGVGLALLIDRLDRRLRAPEQIAAALGTPILGSIPLQRRRSREQPLEPRVADVLRGVHANLHFFQRERELRAIMFASLDGGDGGRSAAEQFAVVAAENASRILMIHADMRAPTEAPGLSTVLAHGATLRDVAVRWTVSGGGVLDVLEPGPGAGSPINLLGSPRMTELLRMAREEYDLVVVDAPPLGTVPDGIPLARGVDGVVVVVRLGAHAEGALRDLRGELDQLDVDVVGAILNGKYLSGSRYGFAGGAVAPEPLRRI
jgi:Mrp family chromosome partitioning ATPase